MVGGEDHRPVERLEVLEAEDRRRGAGGPKAGVTLSSDHRPCEADRIAPRPVRVVVDAEVVVQR